MRTVELRLSTSFFVGYRTNKNTGKPFFPELYYPDQGLFIHMLPPTVGGTIIKGFRAVQDEEDSYTG